jgi:quercetin dioxygenase-like cupin family protein
LFVQMRGENVSDTGTKRVELLLASDELTVTWSWYAPGEPGPDPHVHREHTDAFGVLTGELHFRVGPSLEPLVVRAGEFLAVPPEVAHAFVNGPDAEATFLNFHAPDGGFAGFMRGSGEPWDSHDPPPGGGLPAAVTVHRT